MKRVLAATLMVPVLTVLSVGIGLFAAYIGINMSEVTTVALFTNQIVDRLTFGDVLPAVIKTFFFGFAIGLIGCYKGYYADKGTEGVGRGPLGYLLTDQQFGGQVVHPARQLAGTSDTLAATLAGLKQQVQTGGGHVAGQTTARFPV